MRNRGFSLVIIVFSVLLLAVVSYFLFVSKPFSTTNKSLSQPRTIGDSLEFIDNKKNFTFQYPKGAEEIKSSDPTPIGGTSFQANYKSGLNDEYWYVQVVNSPFDGDVVAQLAQTKEELKKTYTRVEDIKVAGVQGVIYYLENNPGRIIEFGYKGFWYSIAESHSGKSQENIEDAEKGFSKVYSTFKLLK